MGYDAAFQNFSTVVQTYWQNVTARMNAVRTKVEANNYKADDLAGDVAGSWVEAVNAWVDVLPPFAAPVVPTGFMVMPAAAPALGTVAVTLVEAISQANVANVRASDLGQLGGNNSISANDVNFVIAADKVTLSLQQPGSNPAQPIAAFTAGVYQGVLYVVNGTILAHIVLVAY